MFRENLLYSEIQSLSDDSTSRNKNLDYDREDDFDEQLTGLVKNLRNTLDSVRYEGAKFLKEQKNLTGIRPIDFNTYGKVSTLRGTAGSIVLEKMIPLIIQSKRFRSSSEVVEFFNSFEKGNIIQIFTDILIYSPFPDPDTLDRKKSEKRQEVLRLIKNKSQIEITDKPTPTVQTGVEPKDSINENIVSPSIPDNPGINITGRFEFVNTGKKTPDPVLGMILCINQAGNWLEGVISIVTDGTHVNANVPKKYFRFYAEVKYWNKRIDLLYIRGNADFYSQGIQLKISHNDQIDIWYKTKDKTDALLEFWRVSSTPILTERHFKTLDNPFVKQSQWFPLLSDQLNNIVSYLKSFNGYYPILDYSNPKDSGAEAIRKIERRKVNFKKLLTERDKGNIEAGSKLFSSFSQFVEENFHESDHLLASFYCRYYLQQNILIGQDNWRLSYLYALIRYWNIDGYADRSATKFLSNGNENMFTKERHEYVMEAKMVGLGGFFWFAGVGYYRGDLTITSKQWEKIGVKDPVVLRISLGEIGLGIGGGVNLGKSFKAVAVTNYLWKPDDFIGSYVIKKMEAGVSGYGVAGIGGLIGVMDIDSKKLGKSLSFQVYDLDANILGISMEPDNKELESPKPKPKLGADISQSLGAGSIWKGGKLPTPTEDLRFANEATQFGKLYAGVEKNHFKHNSAILTLGAANALRKMCANEMVLLINKATKVEITGYADRSGKEVYNEKLSINRAKNVAQKMKDICGSSLVATISIKGMGEKEAKREGRRDRRKNPIDRKVEIKINGVVVLRLIG
jgi:outer membrane protein OmpA-like peptidoglycan-associated protein